MILTKFDNGEEDKIETEVEECRYLYIIIESKSFSNFNPAKFENFWN